MYTVTARIDETTQMQLEKLAEATERSRSWLVSEAVKQYIHAQSWQIEAIKEGIKQADANDFASDAEVAKAFSRWGVDANN